SIADVIKAAHEGFIFNSDKVVTEELKELLQRGGLSSMMDTVALIMCALSFGGIMERTGALETIARALLKRAQSRGSLVTTTIFSCIGMNLLAADQYLAIVIPGRMYKKAYDDMGLHPKNLSRALEDSGTLTSPLIPWNTCGAFMGAALGVNPLAYLPYAFLNLCNPLVSIFYGYTGITMHQLDPNQENTPTDSK
ncbi:Na+/H+ antiporter NhaC family protein, partial [Planctomycetota bacterium]